MVVRAEVSERTYEGVFISGVGSGASSSGSWGGSSRTLVGDVVDAVVLVRLAVGVHHGGLVSFAGKTIFLQVPLFLAVPASGVGVPQDGVGAGLVVAVGASLLEAERSDLIESFIIVGIPDDLFGHILAKFMFDSGEFVQPLLVVQDGLQVAGGLDAFYVGGLLHFKHLIAKAVFESGEEELVLDKKEGVSDSFGFISASVAPAAMVTRTAAMAAGFLSVRRL